MNYNHQLDLLSLEINRDINTRCITASAFFDFKINELLKNKNYEPQDVIPDIKIIQSLLKKRGYSKYGNIYTKGFVYVMINEGYHLRQINIKHDIKGAKWYIINESFVTGLSIALTYFERI